MSRKITLLALLLAGAVQLPAQVLFTVTDLGTLGGNHSQATAVNNAGQVVGFSNDSAFIYTGGTMTAIATLGGTTNRATDINASGQVVGFSSLAGDSANGGYLFSGGVVTPLNTLGGPNTMANAINDSGAIAGSSQRLSGNVTKPVVWSSGGAAPTVLSLPNDANGGSATGINNSGAVTGNAFYDGPLHAAPFISATGVSAVELPFFGDHTASNVTRISDTGAIAGTFSSPSSSNAVAYIFPAGSTGYDPLFDFFGSTTARDINNQNIVVGSNNLDTSAQQAYRFDTNLGEWVGLNHAVNLAASGFTHLTQATGISDNGLIVGYGTTTGGETHAFLLTPTNVVKFWDGDGTTAGLGQVNGTWSLSAGNWTTNTTGTAAGNGWTNGSYARFLYNASDITVTLADNVSASGILYISGNTGVAITGGSTLTLVNDAVIKVGNTQKGIDLAVVVAGTAGLAKEGDGTLRLSGSNTYTGQTRHHGGDLIVANSNGLGATGAGNETLMSGDLRFDLDGSPTINETIVVEGGGFIRVDPDQVNFLPRTVTLAGPVVLHNNLNLYSGNDTLVISGVISESGDSHGMQVYSATLTGANTFTGNIEVPSTDGLSVPVFNNDGVAGPLGAGSGLNLGYNSEGSGPGRVRYTGGTATSTRTIESVGSEAIIEITNPAAHLTLTGEIGGGGGLAKDGPGKLSLTAANTFNGDTNVYDGILRLANSTGSALGGGNVNVGATATLTGPGTFTGSLSIHGHYAPGDSAALVTLPGNLTLNSGGYIDFEIGGLLRGTQYDAIDIGNTFTSSGGSLSISLINGFSPVSGNSFDLLNWNTDDGLSFTNLNLPALSGGLYWETSLLASSGTLLVAGVPEPSTYALMACGLVLLGLGWRRRARERYLEYVDIKK